MQKVPKPIVKLKSKCGSNGIIIIWSSIANIIMMTQKWITLLREEGKKERRASGEEEKKQQPEEVIRNGTNI